MEHQQKEVVAFQIAEPIYNLSMKMIRTCNPKTLDKKYLKDFKIRPNETLVTLNSTHINPESPKTAKALEDCNFLMNQLELLDKQEFRIKNETNELQEKRYWIHYFQIAQRRKQVILQRNKYKREEWLEKQRPKSQALDMSLNSSINISEYAPYKSPTEMIESWIDSHKQQSDRQHQKFSQIQQKRKEQEELDEEEKIKYKEKLDAIIEKKTKNRENNLKQKQQIAKKDVSKSLEISTKMKTVILEEKYKKAEQKKLQTEQNIEKAYVFNYHRQERVYKMKEQYVNVLEEKQKIYEDKLQQVLKKKEDQDSQLMQSRVKDIQTERSQIRKAKLKKSNEWNLKLPALISRSQAQLQNVYNSNLSSVIEKFKKEEKKKLRTNKSLEQEKEESDKIKHKEEQFTKRWSQKLKQFEDRLSRVQEKFAKKDQYLQEHTQKKKEELEEKFEKIRELSAENERRFVHIKQEYSNKCDQQMDKEIKKFKQNMSLLKQREQIIEQLRHKRFMEKNKSSLASLQGDSISKHSESRVQ